MPTSTQPTNPMTLLVDDNMVTSASCRRRQIPYCTAADSQQALRLFPKHRSLPTPTAGPLSLSPTHIVPFELILKDLQMRVCDGIAATREIRALESTYGWEKSAIFIVTGQDSSSDRVDAEEAGADEYLVKPARPKTLDHEIERWCPCFD